MKHKLHAPFVSLTAHSRQFASQTQAALRWAMLAPAVALTASPVWAALPEYTAPTDTLDGMTCDPSTSVVCLVGSYMKQGINVVAVIMAAFLLIIIGFGSFTKWKQYSAGRIEAGDLKEYLMMAGVMGVVIVALAGLAISYVGKMA
jgi:hypothetical protein